jgi:hypothetical protein
MFLFVCFLPQMKNLIAKKPNHKRPKQMGEAWHHIEVDSQIFEKSKTKKVIIYQTMKICYQFSLEKNILEYNQPFKIL